MFSNKDSIEVKDESDGAEKRFQLYVDGARRGLVTANKNKGVQFHWQPAGPCQVQESLVWILGLLELSVIAAKLEADYDKKCK